MHKLFTGTLQHKINKQHSMNIHNPRWALCKHKAAWMVVNQIQLTPPTQDSAD